MSEVTNDLSELSVKDLVARHNDLASLLDDVEARKSFKTKAVAIAAVEELQSRVEEATGLDAPADETPAAPPTEKAKLTLVPGGARTRKRFDRPPMDEIKPHMPGKKRAWIVEHARTPEGVSFEEVMEANGWNARTAYEGITLVHKHLGWGLIEDADGRIRAFTADEEKPGDAS